MLIDNQDYKIRFYAYTGQGKNAIILTEEVFDDLEQMNAFIERTCHLPEYAGAKAQYSFAENVAGKVAKDGWYYYDIDPYKPLTEDDFAFCLEDAFLDGPYPDRGYVIRSFDAYHGYAEYRGQNHAVSEKKDTNHPRDTYNLTGARKALTSLTNRHYEDMFYSIERLSSYCPGMKPARRRMKKEDLDDWIVHGLKRLDELCDHHDFHRGDMMRINEVRKLLKYMRERL